jgi:conjugal transfer mating pair stabilization protein TraG
MRRPASILFSTLFLLLIPLIAHALDMEFYTYGGFLPVTEAFTKIALIFSDNSYQGLLFVITVIGLLAGAIGYLLRAATGAKIVPLVWAVPVLIGAVLYMAVFVPKGNIIVYDTVRNRLQVVGGVPDAIVFIAGFLNKIEKGMVDIIDTASAPETQYQITAGGIGYKSLASIQGSTPADHYARTSLIRYIGDCLSFELVRPGTSLSLDDLRNNSLDFLDELGQAVHPLIHTVYYDSATPSGTTVTCTDAWSKIRPIYDNPSNYGEAIKKVCSKAFFDPNSLLQIDTCKKLLSNTLTTSTGLATTPEKLLQQRLIAEILYHFYFTEDWETATLMESNRKITSTGLGVGLTMNEWIPIMRAIMTAIAIGVTPFLVLFLPTPVAGKAVSVIFGFFVFLTTWGITDAVIHGATIDFASYAFEDMRQSNLGVYAMAAFPDIATRQLAMFGVIRSAGIMLASFFSMMLIRFGGHALALMAGSLSRIVQSAGAQAGNILTPEGSAAALNQQVRTAGLLAALPDHRFTNMAAAESWTTHRSVGNYTAASNTRAALEDRGQIQPGTSDKDMATMMAAARVGVATDSGPAELTTTADGQTTRTRSETVNPDGSISTVTTGADGSGIAVDTMAQGKATYAIDSANGYTTTHAQVNSLDPVKVGTMMQHQNIEAASKSLGSSKNWQLVMDTAKRASLTDSEAQSFTSRLENAERENWRRAINDQSSFMHSMTEEFRNQFSAAVGAGGIPVLKNIGPRAQLVVFGKNGEQVNFNVSEETVKGFENTAAQVRAETMQNTLQDSKNLDYMTKFAKQIGASEAYSQLNTAQKLSSATESYGADLTTAMVRSYSIEHFGDESPENIRSTISHFNNLATQGSSQGLQQLSGVLSNFMETKSSDISGIHSSISNAINNRTGHVQSQQFKEDIGMKASDAGAATFSIGESSFTPPHTATTPLTYPDSSSFSGIAEEVRQRNLVEKSGGGGIHTQPGDLAKDIAGMNKDRPLPPTNDLYRSDSFYYNGELVEPQSSPGGITLPSGRVIFGETGALPDKNSPDFMKGSVFEKKSR